MTIKLRQDQDETVDKLRQSLSRHQSVLLRAPCGFGKTVVASYMAQQASLRGNKNMFSCHRDAILRQTSGTFGHFGIRHGFIAAGRPSNPFLPSQIASADTLRNRLHEITGVKLFTADEGHLWHTKTRKAIIDRAKEEGAKVILLSATPMRPDGRPLSELVDDMVHGPSESWLIENGHLARYKAYGPSSVDLSGLKAKRNGEYDTAELEHRLDKPAIIGNAVETWKRLAYGKRTVVYCVSRKHGRHVLEAYLAAGVRAVYVDGETSKDDQLKAALSIATGSADVIVSVDLMTTGFDLGAICGMDVTLQCGQFLRPTESLPLAIQMMMRPMRKQDGHAILLDHVNLIGTHGLPDDEREWSLEGRTKKPGEATIPTRTCPECFAVHRPARVCPECGHEYAVTEGRQIEEVAGELAEIDVDAVRRAARQEVGMAKTMPELVALAKRRGYAKGWVAAQMKGRGRPVRSYAEIEREWRK